MIDDTPGVETLVKKACAMVAEQARANRSARETAALARDDTGTLATLVSIIDDPDFDASAPDQIRDLIQ